MDSGFKTVRTDGLMRPSQQMLIEESKYTEAEKEALRSTMWKNGFLRMERVNVDNYYS
jgi:hypothetical protein